VPTVAVFDFLSHEFMHLPFNEGYLRMLGHAFPGAQLVFHAQEKHIEQLRSRLADVEALSFRPCAPFFVPFGLSRHNPIGGGLAARHCLDQMRKAIAGRDVILTSVLGVDANLLRILRRDWPGISPAPLHMILHNHLAETIYWRSRNPMFRAFDFRSVLAKPLSAGQRLVVLELGIKEAVGSFAPSFTTSVATLEHPILVSEHSAEREPVRGEHLKIGFVGHASVSKGFDRFVQIARKSAPDKEFHAIGIGSSEALAMDLTALTRLPSKDSVPRSEYITALRNIDAVCLPLSNSYDYVASGSVIDAIVGLKPLFCLRNRSVAGIFEKYGPIGYLAETAEDLEEFVLHSSMEIFLERRPAWIANLAKIRAARSPEALAPGYAALVPKIG
jgi:hypothetical protein